MEIIDTIFSNHCPVRHENSDVNPLNMMLPANQKPAPDQSFRLSTERQTSSELRRMALLNSGDIPVNRCFGMLCYVKDGDGKMMAIPKNAIRKCRKSVKQKFITIETKIQILGRLKNQKRVADIARHFKLNESTMRTIKQNEEKIRCSVSTGSSVLAKIISRSREKIMGTMEQSLTVWTEDMMKKRLPLDGNVVKQKALKIFNYLKETGQPSTDEDNHQLVATEDDQTFNADETGLWWKKMPSRTFIAKNEKTATGFKVSKGRITWLLCSNASGDFMTTPMFINRSLNPQSMKGCNKNNLAVYWRATKKAWMTASLFNDWLHHCFVLDVENCLEKKNLAFKVLLLLNNAPAHANDLCHPNIQVEFLPPNTTSLSRNNGNF
uniref:DDE-1 domain-containing protein n=1 Tax=Glossina austeni TaxID=7395 RepID=A0A1A9VE80_GLOAU